MLVIQLKMTTTKKINEIEKKITDHNHDKYITTPEFNKLTSGNFAARLAKANLVTKTNFDDKLMNLNKKINSNEKNIYQLKINLQFRGKSHFENDGTQNCLVFQTTQRYFETVSNNNDHILS